MPSKLTKEDVALFVLVGGYCPKCKESPQPQHAWGVYCSSCWIKSDIFEPGRATQAVKDEWKALLDLWRPALAKWAKIK